MNAIEFLQLKPQSKVALVSIGSRGDMEPFLAIGQLLSYDGHEVYCIFPEQFRTLAEETGLHFHSLGPEFIELLNSSAGKAVLGGEATGLKKLWNYAKLAKAYTTINKLLPKRQQDHILSLNPDLILFHPKAVYPVIHSITHSSKCVLLSPVPYVQHVVKERAHIAFNGNYGKWLNTLTYRIAQFGLVTTIASTTKSLGSQVKKSSIKRKLNQIPCMYPISQELFPRPPYWPEHVQVVGFNARNQTQTYSPPPELERFLDQHPHPLYVGFGSMTNSYSEELTATFLEVLEELNQATIFITGGGGLTEPQQYNTSLFHFEQQIPHDYIFPKVCAVVHHGGSGTTHMGLKYKIPTLIFPHIIDQFLWNELIDQHGFGPKGIPIKQVKKKNLKPLISRLLKFNSSS